MKPQGVRGSGIDSLSAHTAWPQRTSRGQDVWEGVLGVGGGIQSALTICQTTCDTKGAILLWNIRDLAKCCTHGAQRKEKIKYQKNKTLDVSCARICCFIFRQAANCRGHRSASRSVVSVKRSVLVCLKKLDATCCRFELQVTRKKQFGSLRFSQQPPLGEQ